MDKVQKPVTPPPPKAPERKTPVVTKGGAK